MKLFDDVFLHIEAAQGGTALARRLEGGFDDRLHGLFGQGGAVHDHGVQAAGFGDERRAGGEVLGHGARMSIAVSVEPVKATPSTRLHPRSAPHPHRPAPGRSCSALSGTPALCISLTGLRAMIGVCSAGFDEHGVARGQARR